MDVQKKLDDIVGTVGSARSMPMSASCVVNRAQLLSMLEEVRAALPDSLAQAEELLGGRERMVDEARQEAERIIDSAHAQRGSLISDTEVARRSQEEADRILAEARQEAEEVRAEADDYVDSKLANFEVVLTKTIGSVDRGREKLLGRATGEDDGYDQDPGTRPDDGPERSDDPATQRERADAYVDAKLGAVAAVLAKTLDAVGKGRQKLLGAEPIDELAAHMAAQDARDADSRVSDDDYLADLAGPPGTVPGPPVAPQQPAQPSAAPPRYAEPAAAGIAADPYGQPDYSDHYPPAGDYQPADQYPAPGDYPQQPVGTPDQGYGYHGYTGYPTDSYAVAGDYQQQQPADPYGHQADPYGWPQQGQEYQHAGYLQGAPAAQQPAAALDETSFFDTSMIDLEQLRQYEGGR